MMSHVVLIAVSHTAGLQKACRFCAALAAASAGVIWPTQAVFARVVIKLCHVRPPLLGIKHVKRRSVLQTRRKQRCRMSNEIYCCRYCGRDTRKKDQMCGRCFGIHSGRRPKPSSLRDSESYGCFPMQSALPDSEEDEQSGSELYHGETTRDDM